MKKYILLLLSVSPGFAGLSAQSLFSTSIDNDTAVYVSGVLVVDNDKKFFITASSNEWFTVLDSSLIIKCDIDGNVIWQKKPVEGLGFKYKPVSLSGMLQLDTSFLMVGHATSADRHGLLMHYSRSGVLLDFKAYDFDYNHGFGPAALGNLITFTDDNHIIMGGRPGPRLGGLPIIWMRTALDGSNPQLKQLETFKDLFPVKFIPMTNGNGEVIMATYTGDPEASAEPEDDFPRLMRVDSSGEYIWIKDFVLPYNATLTDIIRLSDEGYIMVGNGRRKSYILKINNAFEVEWMQSAEFPDTTATGPFPGFYAVCEMKNNHLVIAGSQRIDGTDAYSLLAETDAQGNLLQLKIDSNGNIINKAAAMPGDYTLLVGRDQHNHLNFASLDSSFNHACELTPVVMNTYNDALPVVIEQVFTPVSDNVTILDDFQFFELNQDYPVYDGCSDLQAGLNEVFNEDIEFSFSPNPTDGNITISGSVKQPASLTIKVLDLAGRQLYTENTGYLTGNFSRQLYFRNFSSGTYLLHVIHNGKHEVRKMIIGN